VIVLLSEGVGLVTVSRRARGMLPHESGRPSDPTAPVRGHAVVVIGGGAGVAGIGLVRAGGAAAALDAGGRALRFCRPYRACSLKPCSSQFTGILERLSNDYALL